MPPTWCWMCDGGGHQLQVLGADATDHVVERLLEGQAQVDLADDAVELGGDRAAASRARPSRWPAGTRSRRAAQLAMSVMVSARSSLNALRRLPLRRLSQKRGSHQPTTARDERTRAGCRARAGRSRPGRTTTAGMPTMRRGADGQELAGLECEVGARQLARQVGAPVAPLDDAVEARQRPRRPKSCPGPTARLARCPSSSRSCRPPARRSARGGRGRRRRARRTGPRRSA